MANALWGPYWVLKWQKERLVSQLASKLNRSCIPPQWTVVHPRSTRVISELALKSKQSCFVEPPPKKGHTASLENPYNKLQYTVDNLDQRGVQPDVSTYASLLRLSAQANDLSYGKRVHNHILKSGRGSNKYLGSHVLNMYIKCGALEEADAWFGKMREPNVHSWSFMIKAYATVEDGKRSWQLFEKMQWEGILPQKVTFVYALSVCCNPETLARGKQLHTLIIHSRFSSCFIMGTALVTMYAKCGSLAAARGVFDRMIERDVISWNAMIAAYAQHGDSQEALQVFHFMQQTEAIPNKSTFTSVLDVFSGHAALVKGKRVHDHITRAGLESDIVVATALVNMYGKCGSLLDSNNVFNRMIQRDVILWNTMIAVYTQHEQHANALQLFAQLQNEGWLADQATFVSILNSCASQATLYEGKRMHAYTIWLNFELGIEVGSAIVNMYGKCTDIKEAERVFCRLERRDVLAWTSMIAAYAQNEQGKEALQLFKQMQKDGVVPDKVAFLSILPAYASQAAVIEGQLMHAMLCHIGLESDVEITNALIFLYGKCGSPESARKMFDKMLRRDVVSWNAIIAAYAQHGHGKEVLQLYNQMGKEDITPDCVTYMSVFLACSHAGLLDEGRRCLASMTREHHIVPTLEHYNCLVDLLARAGQLDEAENLLKTLQCEPTYAQWLTLLGACRNQLDVERGERAATQAFKLDPSNRSPYLILSNIYALAGKVNEAEEGYHIDEDQSFFGEAKALGPCPLQSSRLDHSFQCL